MIVVRATGALPPQTERGQAPSPREVGGGARAWIALILALVASACTPGERSEARERYNAGLEAIEAGDWQTAIDDLIAARDEAGPDPELRYRAAFNLGVAHAGKAQELEVNDPRAALDALEDAASWFRDAIRLRDEAEDARFNLELVLHRARVLADRINSGDRGLEARLDQLIEAQRELRDGIRALMTRVEEAGLAADPQPMSADFVDLAVKERTLVAEASTVLDLAAGERELIEEKPEDQRTPEDKARAVRLQRLEQYVVSARVALADTRRLLRELMGDRAHLRADAGLRDLKRAREQLADPAGLLRSLAQDQEILRRHTAALAALRSGGVTLGDPDAAPQAPPPWLTTEHLGARQAWIHERTSELHTLLEGVAAAAADLPPDKAAQLEQQIRVAGEAAPLVGEAATEMQSAQSGLAADTLEQATEAQQRALVALAKAIERFSDLKALVELAYATQEQAVALLAPPDEADDAVAELETSERQRLLDEAVASNADRLARMKRLIADEKKKAEAQLAQAQQQGGGAQGAQGGGGGQAQQAMQAAQAAVQKAELAETLRAEALTEVEALSAALEGARPKVDEARARADAGLEKLAELRKLYFTLVQHIEQLHADQSDTRDRTVRAQEMDDAARAAELGPIADHQRAHAEMGDALSTALAEQADQAQAAAAQGGQDPQAVDQAERMVAAAGELQKAAAALRAAEGLATHARDQATRMSVDLEPTLEEQKKAIDHLAETLRLLKPPQQQDQEQQQNQQQQQQEVSQQEAQRRLQEIREREAKRQKERAARRAAPEPVEKDW